MKRTAELLENFSRPLRGLFRQHGLLEIDKRVLGDLDQAYPRMGNIKDQDDHHGDEQREEHASR